MSSLDPRVQSDPGRLLSASAVMAAGTVVSRLSGFVRAALIVAALGVSLRADQFNVANTIPNMLYILLAGGVFNAVLVPQLVRSMRQDRDGGAAYTDRILTLSTLALAAATTCLILGAPWLLRLFLGPEWFTPALATQLDSVTALSRYCLAQVFFYGMFVLLGQVLNARGHFGPMMWAPIANNLIAIAVLAAYLAAYGVEGGSGAFTSSQELLLGLGSTVGIAMQTAVLLPYLRAAGVRLRPRFDFRHTGLGKTVRLAGWTVAFVVVNQIAYTVVVRLATAGSARAVIEESSAVAGYTVYANAFLLVMVAHSVVTVSLTTAILPEVSRLAAEGHLVDVAAGLGRSLRLALALIVPFAFALVVLGPALATLVFGWGAAEGDTAPLGLTVIAFAPGLILFTVHYLVLRGFYAIEDTRSPFLIQCVIAAVNIALAITLTSLASTDNYAAMLALAYAGSYLVGALLSFAVLRSRLASMGMGLSRFGFRLSAAAAPAAGSAWLVVTVSQRLWADVNNRLDALWLLAMGGAAAAATFLVLARLLRLEEVRSITGTLLRPIRRSSQTPS